MNEVILPRKRWQQIFNVQMIFALIVTILEFLSEDTLQVIFFS